LETNDRPSLAPLISLDASTTGCYDISTNDWAALLCAGFLLLLLLQQQQEEEHGYRPHPRGIHCHYLQQGAHGAAFAVLLFLLLFTLALQILGGTPFFCHSGSLSTT
jgi:hypothetical protein